MVRERLSPIKPNFNNYILYPLIHRRCVTPQDPSISPRTALPFAIRLQRYPRYTSIEMLCKELIKMTIGYLQHVNVDITEQLHSFAHSAGMDGEQIVKLEQSLMMNDHCPQVTLEKLIAVHGIKKDRIRPEFADDSFRNKHEIPIHHLSLKKRIASMSEAEFEAKFVPTAIPDHNLKFNLDIYVQSNPVSFQFIDRYYSDDPAKLMWYLTLSPFVTDEFFERYPKMLIEGSWTKIAAKPLSAKFFFTHLDKMEMHVFMDHDRWNEVMQMVEATEGGADSINVIIARLANEINANAHWASEMCPDNSIDEKYLEKLAHMVGPNMGRMSLLLHSSRMSIDLAERWATGQIGPKLTPVEVAHSLCNVVENPHLDVSYRESKFEYLIDCPHIKLSHAMHSALRSDLINVPGFLERHLGLFTEMAANNKFTDLPICFTKRYPHLCDIGYMVAYNHDLIRSFIHEATAGECTGECLPRTPLPGRVPPPYPLLEVDGCR